MNSQTTSTFFYALISAIFISFFHYFGIDLFNSPIQTAFGIATLSFLLIFFNVKQNRKNTEDKPEEESTKQFTKIGEEIGIKASELAINSAEIS